MLSDPGSQIIRRFGLLNETIPESDTRQYGIPNPGSFVVDAGGIVRSKFFEEPYIRRVTMPTILAQEFGIMPGARSTTIRADHVNVAVTAPQTRVHPGNRLTLIVEITPDPGVHVYAPGAAALGYHPVALTVEPPPHCIVFPPRYPDGDLMEFPALNETAPVYSRPTRILIDVALGSRQELADALAAGTLVIRGRLTLQACDERACYAPQDIPVAWEFSLVTPDTQRVTEALRRETRAGQAQGQA